MSGKQSPSMNHLLSTTLPSAQTREINLKLMSEGWDPCPDWIVTCGGRAEMGEERVSHLPPHPSSQRAVTSLKDGSIHSLVFSAPLSLVPLFLPAQMFTCYLLGFQPLACMRSQSPARSP